MFLLLVLISKLTSSQYLYPEYNTLTRLPHSNPFGSLLLENSILFGVSSSNSIQIYTSPSNLSQYSLQLEIKGLNQYTPVKLWQNSTFLFILTNSVVNDFFDIPKLNTPGYPKLGTRQGILFCIKKKDFEVIESRFTTQCLSGNSTAFDGFSYGPRTLVISKNDCNPNDTVLHVIDQGSFTLGLPAHYAKGFVLNNFLYILCQTQAQDLKIVKFDFFLVVQWSINLFHSTAIDYSLGESDFFLLTQNSLLKISENSSVLFNQYFNSYTFSSLLQNDLGIFLFGHNELSGSMTWLNTKLQVNAQRLYTNITKVSSFYQLTSTKYLLFFPSNRSFYSDLYTENKESSVLVVSQQPFANANCHPSCASCYGTSNATCFSCKYFERLIDSRTVCGTCHPACADCFDSSQSTCLSCSTGHILYNTKCYKDLNCPSGQYQRILQEQCQSCHRACLNCTGSTQNDCLSCSPDFIQDGKSCVSTCPSGKYPHGRSCEICSAECEKCESPGPDSCSSCNPGFYLLKTSCVASCPLGTYKHQGICELCSGNCETCSSFLNCSVCGKGFFLSQGTCVKCSPGCAECDQHECLKCSLGFSLSSGLCASKCDPGSFPESTGNCSLCHSTCKTCSGPLSSNCTSCDPPLILLNKSCTKPLPTCSEHCLNCSDLFTCHQCAPNFFLLNSTCTSQCPSSSIPVQGLCTQCPPRCQTCDVQGCTQCSFDYQRHGSYTLNSSLCSHTLTCIPGYSYSASLGSCQKSSSSSSVLSTYLNSILALFN